MAKTNKQKKEERKQHIQTVNVLKYMKCLTQDDMITWSQKLEEIENAPEEEKEQKTKNLQLWLALKYVEKNRSICINCGRQDSCRRNKEKQKTCSLYEPKGESKSETL